MKRRLEAQRLMLSALLIAVCMTILPVTALGQDVFLASFMDRNPRSSDYVYVSTNGTDFERISIAFQAINDANQCYTGSSNVEYTLHDPAIGYKDGLFWMMTGWVDGNKFLPTFAASRDLIHWSYARTPSNFNSSMDVYPYVPREKYINGPARQGEFKCAGPDYMFDDNGDCWVVVPLGYYGDFYGEPFQDFMQPYICKIEGLGLNSDPAQDPYTCFPYGRSSGLKRINLPLGNYPVERMNLIDPSLYKEDGRYYLSIKKDGVINMIFAIDDLNNAGNPNAWTLINGNVVKDFEGPCLTKSENGTYYYYTDRLEGNGGTGIFYQTAKSIAGPWSSPQSIIPIDENGNVLPSRHGSVVRITDPKAQAVVLDARKRAGFKWARLFGAGRYETMASIVQQSFPDAECAVVASGENYPDALVASSVAGANDAPIVLSQRDQLTADARSELSRLGVSEVIIMGGNAAVSEKVQGDIEAMGITCTRIAGNDRQGTSIEALSALAQNQPELLVVATGLNFADTLSIGPLCYANGYPMVLTGWDKKLSEEQIAAIHEVDSISDILIVGGSNAVSDEVESQLADFSVERIAGNDRYETSRMIAEYEEANGMDTQTVTVASGTNFPDALAGSAFCGLNNSIMLLTDPRNTNLTAVSFLRNQGRGSAVENGYILGGAAAVSQDVYKMCMQSTR